jgi:hypothetical protein
MVKKAESAAEIDRQLAEYERRLREDLIQEQRGFAWAAR